MEPVFSTWTGLRHALIQNAKAGGHQLLTLLNANTNGLYEAMTGLPANGLTNVSIQPHDHTEEGGGAVLPRGKIGGFDYGPPLASAEGYGVEFDAGDVATASYILAGGHAFAGNGIGSQIPAMVTSGIDSTKTNVGGVNPCTLRALALVSFKNASLSAMTANILLQNESTLGTSTATSVSIPASSTVTKWIEIAGIPLSTQSGLHFFRVAFLLDQVGFGNVSSVQIYETRADSQPESAGTALYDSVTAQARP